MILIQGGVLKEATLIGAACRKTPGTARIIKAFHLRGWATVSLTRTTTTRSAGARKPKGHLQDLARFRGSLWSALQRNARSLTGLQVADALRKISDDVYYAGIDSAYTQTKVDDPRNLADAWDLTWLTALNIELLRLARRNVRSKRNTRRMKKSHKRGL